MLNAHALANAPSWCCSWAVPHAHACPCPMPLPHAQDGLLPPIPGRQSSSPHCTRIPSVPKYPGVRCHTAHTLAQATPKTIHQSRYRTKTDRASSRSLSMADAWPLRTVRARARLVLPRLIDAGSVLPRMMTIEHWTPKMGSTDNVGPEASECSSYRVAGSSNSEREKKRASPLSSGDQVRSTSEE